jgi:hypothetical protein
LTGTMRNLKNLCLNLVDVPHVIVEVNLDKSKGFNHSQRPGKRMVINQIVFIFGINSTYFSRAVKPDRAASMIFSRPISAIKLSIIREVPATWATITS